MKVTMLSLREIGEKIKELEDEKIKLLDDEKRLRKEAESKLMLLEYEIAVIREDVEYLKKTLETLY